MVHNKPDTLGVQNQVLIFTLGSFCLYKILTKGMSSLPVLQLVSFEGSGSFMSITHYIGRVFPVSHSKLIIDLEMSDSYL